MREPSQVHIVVPGFLGCASATPPSVSVMNPGIREHLSSDTVKILGRRTAQEIGGLPAAAKFLDMVIALRGDKPFIPRGFTASRASKRVRHGRSE